MIYRVTHSTRYAYSQLVATSRHALRLTPRTHDHQICRGSRTILSAPSVERRAGIDYFGNNVEFVRIEAAHRELEIQSESLVELRAPEPVDPASTRDWSILWDRLDLEPPEVRLEAEQYRFESPNIVVNDALADYARASFVPGRPLLEAALDLNRRIFTDFSFDPAATTLSTPVEEVFRMRRGVCQDFAHLMIACLRSLGLPARYVSGYLLTRPPPGQARLVGADQSHAWVSLFTGSARGWVDLDPTNDMIPATEHVTLAWGRDYGDISPVRGVLVGGGAHTLEVSVDMAPVEAAAVSRMR